MRWGLASALLLVACGGPPEASNLCEEAQLMFQSCGVRVPLISDGPCAGLRRSAATCIMDHGESCETLAELTRAPDTCFESLIEPPQVTEPSDPIFPEDPERWDGDQGE